MALRRLVLVAAFAALGPWGCGDSDPPLSPGDDPQGPLHPPEVDRIPATRLPGIVYRRTDLPFVPTAINGRGDVVGTLRDQGTSRAVVWRGGMMTFLPGLAGGDSQAADIDESGVVVGSAVDALGRSRAVRWVNGVPEDLGTLGGEESAALGMNNVGQVVGMSETEGEPSGFLWSEGELSALPPMPPNPFGWAEDINDQGVAVGSSAGAPTQDATLWIAGVPSKLPSLAFEAGATAVGEDGVVVGGSIPDDQESARGVRWVEGRVEELPTPPEANFSSANDINRLGQIVGHAAGAVIWHGDGYRQIDTVGYGRGINDQGQVVASWLGGIGYSWEPQRSFAARPQRDTVEPPTGRRGRHPPPGLRPSSSGLCRAPPLMSAKVENALRVAGCIE